MVPGAGKTTPPAGSPPDRPKRVVTGAGKATASSSRSLVDNAFGGGTYGRLSKAAREDVAACIAAHRMLEAGFSAAHYLAFGNPSDWPADDQQRMVQAWRSATEEDRRSGWTANAAARCAYLRLLRSDLPDEQDSYAEALQEDLQNRLRSGQLDVRTAATAGALFLISDEWLPDREETDRLILAVKSEVAARQVENDEIMAAARLTLWLVATRASHGQSPDG